MRKIIIYLLFVVMLSYVSSADILEENIAYYTFDTLDINETHAFDISPSGFNGSLHNITVNKTGVRNASILCNGTNAYFNTSYGENQNISDKYTINFWINTSGLANGDRILGASVPGKDILEIAVQLDKLEILTWDESANKFNELRMDASFAATFATGGFEMVTVIFNGTDASKWSMYHNGTKMASTVILNDVNQQSSKLDYWYVCARNRPGDSKFSKMNVDELGIWTRDLTQAEITSLYNTLNPYATQKMEFTQLPPVNESRVPENSTLYYRLNNVSVEANVSYYINDTWISTRTGHSNGTFTLGFNSTVWNQGWNFINLTYADKDENFSRTKLLFVDNTGPAIDWNYPLKNNNTHISTNQTFTVNITLTDTLLDSVNLTFFNSTGWPVLEHIVTNPSQPVHEVVFDASLNFSSINQTITMVLITGDEGNFYSNMTNTFLFTNVYIEECPYPATTGIVLNFTVINDSTDALQNANISASFNYTAGIATFLQNFSFQNESNSHSVCISDEYATVTANFQVVYSVNGKYYNYFGDSLVLSNSTTNITLLVVADTTQVLFNVKDTFGSNVEDVYIYVEKYDVGTNTYSTSEVLLTDNSGNAIGNIILNTQFYRFTLVYDSQTLLVDGPTLVTDTTKNFIINTLGDDYYDSETSYGNMAFNLSYNNVTSNFKLEFSDPELSVYRKCMKVEYANASSSAGFVLVNETCLTSATGQILLNIGSTPMNRTYVATAYAFMSDGTYFIMDTLEINFWALYKTFDDDGKRTGVFFAFIFILAILLIGRWNPIASIILAVFSVLLVKWIGLYSISYSAFMVLAVMGGTAIWKINRAK